MNRLFDPPIFKDARCSCGAEYKAKHVELGGELRDTSSGRCPKCAELERQVELTRLHSEGVAKRREAMEVRRKAWREMVIPPKFIGATFKTFNPQRGNLLKVYQSCLKYADNFPIDYVRWVRDNNKSYPSVFLCSVQFGVGKSHLACAIVNKILDRWQGENVACPVYVISEDEIYPQITNTYSFDFKERQSLEGEFDIINHLQKVPLLILDDLGKSERSDLRFVQRVMFSIINGRYKNNRPMVVTTNMSGEELARYLGKGTENACLDRLMEMCRDNMWEIRAESYRINPNG